jgi:hypothetical protein
MMRLAFVLLPFLLATAAAAQQQIFDADDFVNPDRHDGPVFSSRLIAGAALNFIDDYRPRHHDAGFVQLANSFYWSNFQFDYKRSEIRSGPAPAVQMCPCNAPIFFPTPPSADSTPAAPPPGGKDTVQVGAYFKVPRPGQTAVTLRARLTFTQQHIDTDVTFPSSADAAHLSGRERSVGFETDTYLPFGRGIFGTLQYARTERSGTAGDRKQQEIVYTNRFPVRALWNVAVIRALLTVGAVTDRGGTALNVVNPAVEAFYHHPKTHVSLHLVYNPQATRSGAGGWETHHQIALFADWGKVWFFKPSSSSAPQPRSPSSPAPTSHR